MMTTDHSRSRLTEKSLYFREFNVWPLFDEFDTELWLSNFKPVELRFAEQLLNNFCFINEKMTDALLRAAIQNLFCHEHQVESGRKMSLQSFFRESAFVLCEGETSRPTDSGNLFSRKLRDKILIPEHNIMWADQALKRYTEYRRFIFVDDFAGSGNQLLTTWKRKHIINGVTRSFSDISHAGAQRFAYCCCICSWKAKQRLSQVVPKLGLWPAHFLENHYSAVHPSSRIWKSEDFQDAQKFLKEASNRAGYTGEGAGTGDWRGFSALGLTLAFHHGIPDASLPLFYSRRDNWKPLMVRAS